jgi:hypothetical protein
MVDVLCTRINIELLSLYKTPEEGTKEETRKIEEMNQFVL